MTTAASSRVPPLDLQFIPSASPQPSVPITMNASVKSRVMRRRATSLDSARVVLTSEEMSLIGSKRYRSPRVETLVETQRLRMKVWNGVDTIL